MTLSSLDRQLLGGLQHGLAASPQPFDALAAEAGCSVETALQRIGHLQQSGVIRRLGLIVRHRKLGYTANAMVVWNVDDADVERVAAALAASDAVALCYRRPRRLPDWPYNLFCMLYGRSRDEVLARLQQLIEQQRLQQIPHEVLFSVRCFKQTGGRYV